MPNPCGANAVCREQNGVGACQCVDNYFGNPYEGCRPECVLSSDCPSNKACVRYKCVDPCPGVCGQNAECLVVNHLPTCNCFSGYTGDAYRYCHLVQNERKSMVSFYATNISLSISVSLFWISAESVFVYCLSNLVSISLFRIKTSIPLIKLFKVME